MEFLLVGVGMVVAFALIAWQRQAYADAVALFAGRNGLIVRGGGWFSGYPTVSGTVDGASVVLDTYTVRSGKRRSTYHRMRVTDPKGPADAVIRAEGVLSSIGKVFNGGDVQIGDPAFDAAVLVRGDAPQLRARLREEARAAVIAALRDGWELSQGEWQWKRQGLERDGEALHAQLSSAVRAAQALRLVGTVEDALLQRAKVETHPGVAARCLQERLALGPVPLQDLEEIAGSGGMLAIVAAEAMGERGVRILDSALTDPNYGFAAALVLARMGYSHAGIEQLLIFGLDDEARVDASIGALAMVGTVASVPALQRHEGGWLASARGNAASAAIRAIQGRVVGAEHGDLSSADLGGGGL